MRGRPVCGLAVAFAAGIAVAPGLPFDLSPAWLMVCLSPLPALLGTAGLLSPHGRRPAAAIVIFGCLGVLAGRLAQPSLPAPVSLEPFLDRRDSLVLAEVTRSPDFYPDRLQLPLRIIQIITPSGCFPVEGGALLMLSSSDLKPGEWLIGDRLLGRMTLKPFHNFNNPGGFDYVASQAERGFYARAHAASGQTPIKLAPHRSREPARLFRRLQRGLDLFRQQALWWLKEHEAPEVAGFYAVLLLGYRHQLSKEWLECANRAGVTHLLAISGLHLTMVSATIFWLTSRLIRLLFPSLLQRTSDRWIALWVAFLFALMYSFIGGLALPTWLAAILLLLVCGAVYCYRWTDFPSLLAAAATIMLVISPNVLRQVSFQLSFAAMVGLFLFFPRLQKIENRVPLHRLIKPFPDALLLSVAASVTVFPLIAHYFSAVSLAGLAANTVLVPLVGLLVQSIGLFSLAVFALNETLAWIPLKLGGWLVALSLQLIAWFGSLSWGFIWVGLVPAVYLAAFYAALALLLCSWRWRHKAAALVALCLFMCGYALLGGPSAAGVDGQSLHVTAIDVGQGSSTLVRFPLGETMLVDGGGFFDDSFDVGRCVLAPFLWHCGIRKLDYVVLSHDHPDHRNGLRFVLSHFPVGRFWETGITDIDNGGRGPLQDIVRRRRLPVSRLPQVLQPGFVGPCRVQAIHPSSEYVGSGWDQKDLNNVSLVVRIEFGGTCVIIPGDIDSSVERLLFDSQAGCGDLLLIAPHHGSARSNSALMLDRLHPGHIVFSCGRSNPFGFPADEVLARCRDRGIIVHRTDLHGAVTASSDGSHWKIERHLARSD